MKRKINKVGQNTLTVSLPKEWVERNHLKKGDEVEVSARNDVLTVFGKQKEEKSIELNVPNNLEIIHRFLKLNYTNGIDEIRMSFKDKKSIHLIEKAIPKYIGFEIIERTDNSCIIRIIADIREGEFDKLLKKMFNLVSSMGKELYDGLKEGKMGNLSHIDSVEQTVNKLYVFCQRYINTSGWKIFKVPTLYYVFIQKLENIADNFSFISQQYSTIKNLKMNQKTIEFLEDVLSYLQKIQNYYYNFSVEGLNEIYALKNSLIEKATKVYKLASRDELLLIGKLLDIIKLIFDAASPIFDIKNLENKKN